MQAISFLAMQMVRLDGRYAKAGIDAEIGTG